MSYWDEQAYAQLFKPHTDQSQLSKTSTPASSSPTSANPTSVAAIGPAIPAVYPYTSHPPPPPPPGNFVEKLLQKETDWNVLVVHVDPSLHTKEAKPVIRQPENAIHDELAAFYSDVASTDQVTENSSAMKEEQVPEKKIEPKSEGIVDERPSGKVFALLG
jgi:hypothetical protein